VLDEVPAGEEGDIFRTSYWYVSPSLDSFHHKDIGRRA
jgi:hypothetical protein